MLHFIINPGLYHDTPLDHQHCIISSMLHYIINAALYHQHYTAMLRLSINVVLDHQRYIKSLMLLYIINAALYHQHFIKSALLNYLFNTNKAGLFEGSFSI